MDEAEENLERKIHTIRRARRRVNIRQYGGLSQGGRLRHDPRDVYIRPCALRGYLSVVLPCGRQYIRPIRGGAARGVVAELTGHHYVGIDLSVEQITQNKQEAERLGITPEWYCDDSLNMDEYIKDGSADMVFTCPPYADLEVYSDDPRDISNMSYEGFSDVYARILTRAAAKLKDDIFMAVVIGDVRDKEGIYRGLVGLTADILTAAGLKYYNELIKVDPIGTAAYRARQTFRNRKCVKIHQ